MIKKEELGKIGQFVKPHGVKGEIALMTDFDLTEIPDDPYIVCEMDGIFVPFFIDSLRPKSSTVTLVKLSNIDSEDYARIFNGKDVYVNSEFIHDANGEITDWDCLIGYAAFDDKHGSIGSITDIDDNTINVLLQIDYDGNEILVPAALVISINQESKSVNVSLPEGFLEI